MDQDPRCAELGQALCPLQEHLGPPVGPGLWTRPGELFPASRIASAASRRLARSFSGSCSRKTSIPFAAALATKRRTMSAETGLEPTRKRPRRAIPSGVEERARIERMRSQGLSTRRTALSNSRRPKPRACELGTVQLGDELVKTGRRDTVGERLLGEEPDRRVDELRHA